MFTSTTLDVNAIAFGRFDLTIDQITDRLYWAEREGERRTLHAAVRAGYRRRAEEWRQVLAFRLAWADAEWE